MRQPPPSVITRGVPAAAATCRPCWLRVFGPQRRVSVKPLRSRRDSGVSPPTRRGRPRNTTQRNTSAGSTNTFSNTRRVHPHPGVEAVAKDETRVPQQSTDPAEKSEGIVLDRLRAERRHAPCHQLAHRGRRSGLPCRPAVRYDVRRRRVATLRLRNQVL